MIFSNVIEKKDTIEIVESKFINWIYFKNSTILVTGATGLIGSQIVKSLLYANEVLGLGIKIIALIRNQDKANKTFGNNQNITYIVQDVTKQLIYNDNIDYIIHTANGTASKTFVENPVETIDSIVTGTKNILEFAKNKKAKSLVYLSSMEVYGQTSFEKKESLKESDYGYVDILQARSSYPEGKRLAEALCGAYANEYNLPVKIARLVQTIGAGVDITDNRVFVQFAKSIVNKENITLHTTGESSRSYCYITDAITAIFKILESGKNGTCYNVANEKTNASIKDMAKMLCDKYNLSLKFEPNDSYYPPASKLHVDTKLLQDLGWEAKIELEEMYNRLIAKFSNN